MAENMIVEILDGDTPCEPGEIAGIVVTELNTLVMPSLCEAFGFSAAEAFILGCPVIASNCIG